MTLETMIAEHGERGAETLARLWALRLRTAGEAMESAEVLELADTVDEALVRDGIYGVLELALAGPALGGLGANDLERLVATIGEDEAADAVAA